MGMHLIPLGPRDTLKRELQRRARAVSVGVQPLGCPCLHKGESSAYAGGKLSAQSGELVLWFCASRAVTTFSDIRTDVSRSCQFMPAKRLARSLSNVEAA